MVDIEILNQTCTMECHRFAAGTCPYKVDEKDICPRVKEVIEKKDKSA